MDVPLSAGRGSPKARPMPSARRRVTELNAGGFLSETQSPYEPRSARWGIGFPAVLCQTAGFDPRRELGSRVGAEENRSRWQGPRILTGCPLSGYGPALAERFLPLL